MHHRNRGQFADAERYSTALLRDPSSTFGDKLEHLTVLHASRSPTTNAFLATLEGEASTNVFAAGDLIARMIELGRAADAIAWLKSLPANMQKEEPLPMALASSYFALGRWKELEESLKSQQWREREFVRRALMAYAERQQNSTKDSAAHWKDAVQLASARPELLGTLAQTAAAWGWTNEAESVLWRAAKEFPKERWPIDALQNGYMRLGNTRALYELTRLAREHQPANVFAQNTWTILSLLLNTNLAQAHPMAKQVHERDAKNPAFATTYAYSLHLQGKTAEALKVMESLSPAQLEEPSIAMYYGLFLAASGQAEKAKHFLAKAEQAVLLPEETQLVAEARKKQATTAAPLRQN
jgi:predicted Zn-dependent protease